MNDPSSWGRDYCSSHITSPARFINQQLENEDAVIAIKLYQIEAQWQMAAFILVRLLSLYYKIFYFH